MSTVRLLSPGINLIDEAVEVLLSSLSTGSQSEGNKSTADLSRMIVVFPGKRPAHVLRKKIAERIGSSFLPPRIFSVDLFVNFVSSTYGGNATRPVNEFDAVAILFDLHKGLQSGQKIGQEHFATLETFYPVGVKIFSEMEELLMASVRADQLAGAVSSVTLTSAHALALLFAPFYSALNQRGLTSRAMQYHAAAGIIDTIDCTAYDTILFAGFFAFTRTEETIVRSLMRRENVTLLFQNGEGIRSTLDRLDLHPETEGVDTEQQIWYYESPDAHGQLSALNQVFDKHFSGPIVRSDEAVIVLPSSENLFPLYHQTLSVFDQSAYNLALGYPLSRTPVYGFIISLLEVIVSSREGKVFVPKYIQFLLHPYTKNILLKNRTDVTRIIVHSIEDFCLEHSAKVFMDLDDIERDPHLHDNMMKRLERDGISITSEELRMHLRQIHTVTLRSFFHIRTISDFADSCIAVLQFINEYSTAHRHPYFRPFVETMLEQFVLVKESLLSKHSFGSPEHYLLFVRHCIESAEVPFTGTPLQGLQVLGFLETRGLKFDTLLMIDVNDDILPGRAQQDVLLPLQIREQLGLSTYRDQEKIKAYIFDVLRRGASTVHYFYVNNNEKEQSRYIGQLQWQSQVREKSLRKFNTRQQEYRIDLGTPVPPMIQKNPTMLSVLKGLAYSSTALDTYLTCRLQFYYRYVLRLREKNEISGDVEHIDIGKLIHAVFYEYFGPLADKELDANDLDQERLKRIIHDQFRLMYGESQFGEQYFTRQQVEKHLAEYFEKVQKPILNSAKVRIESLEEKFETEIGEIRYTGSSDRIETRDGTTYILDFKTGHQEKNYLITFDALDPENRETWKSAIGSIQLPMYVMLYSALRNVPVETIVPAFVFIGKKDLEEKCEVPLFASAEQMNEWYPKLREIISAITREILDESVPFTATKNMKEDCPSCSFRVMCGTQWAEKFSVY